VSYILIALVITNVYKGFTVGFDQTLLYFGAPALCGLKAASLVSIDDKLAAASEKKLQTLNAELGKNGRGIINVKRCGSRTLFFLYDRKVLQLSLSGKKELAYLAAKNYPVRKGFNAILSELLKRLSFQESFPHEIGIFLGYPLEDVILFEKQKGEGCLYSGMWKVYGNVQESLSKMTLYRNCCMKCNRLFERGMKLTEISRDYNTIGELPESV